MDHLGSLLAALPLPELETDDVDAAGAPALPVDSRFDPIAQELAGDLPAGHLHVWGGPSGAGKTSLLLSLLHGAAARGRPVVYATYDLAPATLAMRTLAMLADVDIDALPDPGGRASASRLGADEAHRAVEVRAALASLPFYVLPARGFSVASLADRIVRVPERAQVLVVDYVQAVIRDPGTELGAALRELSELAMRLHVAVVCVFRAEPVSRGDADEVESSERQDVVSAADAGGADRAGWIAPADGSGARRAEILRNRYGERPSLPFHLDASTGRLAPFDGPRAPRPGSQLG